MRTQSFTDEEVKDLRENSYTAFVSKNTIRFTLEFKKLFWEKRRQGATASRIFHELGYDVDVLGRDRIKNFSKRIRREAVSAGGLHEGYSTHRRSIKLPDGETMTQEELLVGMQRELLQLRQEINLMKQMIKADK